MALSSLFYGMEAYLDGDVEINNNVTTPEDTSDVVADAQESAEVASDVADASVETKDSEVTAQMLIKMGDLYQHVKQYGIDRTFVSLYNRHGELDHICNMKFPACESFSREGNRYSKYSSAFIAAMEDEKVGWWQKVKNFIKAVWEWITEKAFNLVYRLVKLIRLRTNNLQKLCDEMKKQYDTSKIVDVSKFFAIAAVTASKFGPLLYRDFSTITKVTQDTTDIVNFLSRLISERIEIQINTLTADNPQIKEATDTITANVDTVKNNEAEILKLFRSRQMTYFQSRQRLSVSEILKTVELFATNCNKTLDLAMKAGDSAKDAASAIRKVLAKARNVSESANELGKLLLNVIKSVRSLMMSCIGVNNRLAMFSNIVYNQLKSKEFVNEITGKKSS